MDFKYLPILRTLDAELNGYEALRDEAKQDTFPLFELTRSRITKKNPIGDVRRRMSNIESIMKDRPFVLDLTAHADQLNYQIEELLDHTNGFANWVAFLQEHKHLNITPIIHVNPDAIEETVKLVAVLKNLYPLLAFRFVQEEPNATLYLDAIASELDDLSRLIFIADCSYLEPANYDRISAWAETSVSDARAYSDALQIVAASSSFPKFVVGKTQECGDAFGQFEMMERRLFKKFSKEQHVIYGDYGSIHPLRYETPRAAWVPRIDYPTTSKFIYTRYRREAGGYEKAAKEMLKIADYHPINCWGCEEIQSAADGNPNGKSPAHWIAVRLNIHITQITTNSPEP